MVLILSLIRSDGDREYLHILDSYFEIDDELINKLRDLRKKLQIFGID